MYIYFAITCYMMSGKCNVTHDVQEPNLRCRPKIKYFNLKYLNYRHFLLYILRIRNK